MALDQAQTSYGAQLRRLTVVAIAIVGVLIGGGVLWAALTSVDGAVIAQGRITTTQGSTPIELAESGYIARVHVEEGDLVEAGDLLLAVDDTQVRTELEIVQRSLLEVLSLEVRLVAQIEDRDELIAYDEARAWVGDGAAFAQSLAAQTAVLEVTNRAIDAQVAQLDEQINQLREEMAGLDAQVEAREIEIVLIEEELVAVSDLVDQGLATQVRANALSRERAQLLGQLGALIADIASTRSAISEREVQKLRIREDARAGAAEALQNVRLERTQLLQQKVAIEDRLRRLDVRSPRAGIVQALAVNTVDALVEPGQALMTIVPRNEELIVEARVLQNDIDEVNLGQGTQLQFVGLSARATPQLEGFVTFVSPDLERDEVTGEQFYTTRIAIEPDQWALLDGQAIIQGMPVDAFLVARERRVSEFLLQPLTDHLARAFREQ